jgi:tetratricopeptide (TPR) repeat protein
VGFATYLLAVMLQAVGVEHPDYPRAVEMLEKGQTAQALELLQKIARAQPDNAQVWKAIGVGLARANDIRSSADAFHKACTLSPSLPDACYYEGRALYSLNQFEAAQEPLRKALLADWVKSRSETAIAENLEALGRSRNAEEMFRWAISRSDRGQERARLAYARFLIRAGRTEESLKPLEDVLALNANSAEAHFQKARALVQMDKIPEALPHAEQAAQMEPGRAPARLLLARVYRRLGRNDEADREERAARNLQGSLTERN